jgi:uncharacterized protein YjbI with pentapeptide repeats
MNRSWKKYLLYALYILVGLGLVYGLIQVILIGYSASWTGFTTKTLWDWMDLLIIPLVFAGGAFYLNRSERAVEREIATDRQQEAALQAYIGKISELLLEKKLLTTKRTEVSNVARTLTLTVVRGLDAKRKGLVLRFLCEAELLRISKKEINFFLQGADLSGADLSDVILYLASLEEVNLINANLRGTALVGADLINANLSGADLSGADLGDAELVDANLSGADLSGAHLGDANLMGANLRGANLRGASLSGADLSYANLEDAKVTKEQLAGASLLKGATMPDGTKQE